jgi:hypothetical protein
VKIVVFSPLLWEAQFRSTAAQGTWAEARAQQAGPALPLVRLCRHRQVVIGQESPPFILAAAGKNLGILDDRATNTRVAAAIVSVMLNPVLYRLIGPLEAALRHFVRTPVPVDMVMQSKELYEQAESGRFKAVVVGYGPVGRTLARLLRENEFALVIIELNADTVRELTSRGIRAI